MWNLNTGRSYGSPMVNRSPGKDSCAETSVITCLELPGGKPVIAAASEDETVSFWDLARQSLIATLPGLGWVGGMDSVPLANGHPGLVIGGNTLTLWNLMPLTDGTAAQPQKLLDIELDAPIRSLVTGEDSSSLAVCTLQGLLRIQLHPMARSTMTFGAV